MENLLMCRVCLAEEIRMHIISDVHLQEIYEAVSTKPFNAGDGRPTHVCFICYASLQNSYKLRKKCLETEELLTQILCGNFVKPVIYHNGSLKMVHPVVEVDIQDKDPLGTDDQNEIQQIQTVQVKMEYTEDNEDETNENEDKRTQGADSELLIKEEFINTETCPDFQETNEKACRENVKNTTSPNVVQTEISVVTSEKESKNTTIKVETIKPEQPKCKVISQKMDCTKTSTKKHESADPNPKSTDTNSNKQTGQNICYICRKRFRYRCLLISHIRVHSNMRPYQCTICGKGFNYSNVLREHIRTHTGEKPYQCDVCKKSFRRQNHLKDHKLIHTGVKPHHCVICNKTFNGKKTFNTHVRRTHIPYIGIGEKPYKCDVCMKRFKDKSTLNRHLFAHSGEKPYQCDVCQKTFTTKKYLASHMRVHTGEKPYQCSDCVKCFSSKCDLIRHFRVHSGEKPYECEQCNKCFSTKSSLNSHLRVHARRTGNTELTLVT